MASTVELCVLAILGLFLLYWILLPRVISGIPFNRSSKRSILGDIPILAAYVKKHRDPFTWMAVQCQKLQSPVAQVWIRVGRGPTVIVSDFCETQDILVRRAKEFERSSFFSEIFDSIVPRATISKKTDDTFKIRRRAFAGTMSPAFIHGVAAPQIHDVVSALVRLWQAKRSLAGRRPISIADDLQITIFDAIWAITFGTQLYSADIRSNALPTELCTSDSDADRDNDKPVLFPGGKLSPIIHAIRTIVHSVESVLSSPLPRQHHWVICHLPPVSSAIKLKSQAIHGALTLARTRLAEAVPYSNSDIKSVTDHMLCHVQEAASKGQRALTNAFLQDELHGFLIAGHDTTSSACKWGIKFLADHRTIQRKLRQSLEDGLEMNRTCSVSTILPGSKEIMESSIPYLDAVIEEILRKAAVASAIFREAKVDTQILGHQIPKGTEVFFANMGPGITAPPLPVEESTRSEISRENQGKTGQWDLNSIDDFIPERWLERDNAGKLRYNPNAGPNLAFSAGIRGCFGKRLAYAELRILLALVVLNFDLLPPPNELSSHDAEVKLTKSPRQCYVRLGEIQ